MVSEVWKNQKCGMRYRSARRRWTSEKSRGIIGDGRTCEKSAKERPLQYIAQQPSAAQAAQPNPAQPAQPSPPSRHRAGRKCCNLRCGRTRRRLLTSTDVAVLRAGNLMVFARTPPEYKEKHCFLHASKEDRRGPVGDVRLARAAECIECIAAADCRSDTPLAARRIGSEPLVRLALSCAAIASI